MLRPILIVMLAAGTAAAQTPAERASRALDREVTQDRFLDSARDARGDPRPPQPEVQMFQPERRTLQPDIGRPEEAGNSWPNGTRGLDRMGQNPQR